MSNPCPICLETLTQESYLDQCFHVFCYKCILQWARSVKQRCPTTSSVKCPLCKTENSSIIYGYDGSSFQRHYIKQATGTSSSLSDAHEYRVQCYNTNLDAILHKFDVLSYWKCHKYRYLNSWLQTWLRREIQALIQDADVDVIVHHILGTVESFWRRNGEERFKGTPEAKRAEFKSLVSDAARPFLSERTPRFVDEVELFLASGLTINAYDEVYMNT
ncbi:hypothetical protein QJS10_CPB04g00683 [Acorus calamus]|uniref:RING-type domain-containing protein n=1 Tax=Acorus calamus TaxID=4465 RepID=A0AAV9EZ72_ACOCL|nr:hypothetical protein QJS10_CPB04g00683 [Acorus calamus]